MPICNITDPELTCRRPRWSSNLQASRWSSTAPLGRKVSITAAGVEVMPESASQLKRTTL